METKKQWNKMSYKERLEYKREFEYKGFKVTGCMKDGYCATNGKDYLYTSLGIKTIKFEIDCFLDKDLFNRHYYKVDDEGNRI